MNNDDSGVGEPTFAWSRRPSPSTDSERSAPALFARRFAESALKLYERDKTFTLSVPASDMAAVAEAFRRMGCTVSEDDNRCELQVTVD